MAKANSLYFSTLTPIACAATSLERIACRARPRWPWTMLWVSIMIEDQRDDDHREHEPTIGVDAEDHRERRLLACGAAREPLRLLERLQQDLRDAQGGDRQVDAADPQGDHADEDPDDGGDHERGQQPDPEAEVQVVLHVRSQVGAQPHEAGCTERDQARVAQQQVEPDRHDGVDEDEAERRQRAGLHDAVGRQHGQQEQRRTEDEELYVRVARGLGARRMTVRTPWPRPSADRSCRPGRWGGRAGTRG